MFDKRLRKLRTDKELSQKSLADILGISPSTVAMYEQARRTPDNEMLQKIADYFQVSVDYLLGRTNQRDIKNPYNPKDKVKEILDTFAKAGINPEDIDLDELKKILNTYVLFNSKK